MEGFSAEFLERVRAYGLRDEDLVGWSEDSLDSGLFDAAQFQDLDPGLLGAWMKEHPGNPDRVWEIWAASTGGGME